MSNYNQIYSYQNQLSDILLGNFEDNTDHSVHLNRLSG
jgi:hypothetical protein